MLTSSPTSPIGSRPASTATTAPVEIVAIYGVRSVGCIRPATGGSRPSCAIARKMRGCASSITRMTEVRPKTIAELDERRQPADAGGIDPDRDRIGHVQLVVRNDAGEHQADHDIQHRADRRASRESRSAYPASDSWPPARPSRRRRSRYRQRTPPPRRATMPDQPYIPSPALGGMKAPIGIAGRRPSSRVLKAGRVADHKSTITTSLTATMKLLNRADLADADDQERRDDR